MDADVPRLDRDDRRALVAKVASSHPHELADVVSTMAWSAHTPDELLEHLQRTVDLVVRTTDVAVGAGVTAEVDRQPTTTAHSGELTLRVDAHQYAAGAGPCLHALATGELVTADVATARERWPGFATAADADGVRSFVAAPLRTHADTTIGVLNVYGTRAGGFAETDLNLALLIADLAARTVDDHARLHAAEDLADGLATALSRRAVIEQAKGIVMAVRQLDADAAFEVLRTQSQTSNTKLHQLCTDFVAQHTGEGDA